MIMTVHAPEDVEAAAEKLLNPLLDILNWFDHSGVGAVVQGKRGVKVRSTTPVLQNTSTTAVAEISVVAVP